MLLKILRVWGNYGTRFRRAALLDIKFLFFLFFFYAGFTDRLVRSVRSCSDSEGSGALHNTQRNDTVFDGFSSNSVERSVRISFTDDDTAVAFVVPFVVVAGYCGVGVGEQKTSNGRPLVVVRLDDALSTAVHMLRFDRRQRVSVQVERLQLYAVSRLDGSVVAVVRTVVAAVVHGIGRVRRRTGNVVPVVPGPRARARAHGRVVGRRRRDPAPTGHRGQRAHGQAGHGPVRRDHVAFQPDGALGGLRTKRKL